MTKPLVSIVVPTYNRARLIGRSLASLLVQTEPRFEALVVDDASHDDTEAVVRAIGDPRIPLPACGPEPGPGGLP
ncbi:MAG: glycosyltransferase [Acidobacteria bacterium]|nr:glycosyltransferase [Acidobacteriota bacterium]